MLKQAKEEKNKKTSKEQKPKSLLQQQLLKLQQNQLQPFQDSELRMQEMMLKIFKDHRIYDATRENTCTKTKSIRGTF